MFGGVFFELFYCAGLAKKILIFLHFFHLIVDVDKELRFLHATRVLLVHLPKLFLDGVEARWDAVRSDQRIRSVGHCQPATFNVLKQLTLGEMIKIVCAKPFNHRDWILNRASVSVEFTPIFIYLFI